MTNVNSKESIFHVAHCQKQLFSYKKNRWTSLHLYVSFTVFLFNSRFINCHKITWQWQSCLLFSKFDTFIVYTFFIGNPCTYYLYLAFLFPAVSLHFHIRIFLMSWLFLLIIFLHFKEKNSELKIVSNNSSKHCSGIMLVTFVSLYNLQFLFSTK